MGLVLVHISFPMSEPKPTVRTNAKPEVLSELISDFLQSCHMFKGRDPAIAEDHPVYDVRFCLCLGHVPKPEHNFRIFDDDVGDRWATKSNCGNRGLEAGILMATLGALERGEITPLELDDSSFA